MTLRSLTQRKLPSAQMSHRNSSHTCLWLESTLRRTPVPLYQKQLEVATQMLADPLDYQLSAVKLALSDERL